MSARPQYTCLWNAYKLMTKDLPMADREKLFHDNAVEFYRLPAGSKTNTPGEAGGPFAV